MVGPVHPLHRELQPIRYEFHSCIRARDACHSHKTLLNQPGADAPGPESLGIKNVLQTHHFHGPDCHRLQPVRARRGHRQAGFRPYAQITGFSVIFHGRKNRQLLPLVSIIRKVGSHEHLFIWNLDCNRQHWSADGRRPRRHDPRLVAKGECAGTPPHPQTLALASTADRQQRGTQDLALAGPRPSPNTP